MKTIIVKKAEQFRAWLEKNHDEEMRVGVKLYKRHTGQPAPRTNELMREAICFGWIDTTAKRIDEDLFMVTYVRRNKNSRWSDNTLRYARELIKEGKMTSIGLHYYKLGRAKPSLDYGIPKNPSMPPELKKALAKSKKLQKAFETIPSSQKKMFYRGLLRAKRPYTKEKRIKEIIVETKRRALEKK